MRSAQAHDHCRIYYRRSIIVVPLSLCEQDCFFVKSEVCLSDARWVQMALCKRQHHCNRAE